MHRTLLAIQLLALLLAGGTPAAAQGVDSADINRRLREAADAHERGSFEKAREAYEALAEMELEDGIARYVAFRAADSAWRSAGSSNDPDSSRLDAARAGLEEVLARYETRAERDELWAEIQGSLGDFHWQRQSHRNWASGWSHYSEALDWWAGSREVERARAEYLGIVKRALIPAWWGDSRWGSWGTRVDTATLERARSIAVGSEDRGWTGFFLAYAYQQWEASDERRALAAKVYGEVIELGRGNAWHDDALYHLGLYQEERGELRYDEVGRTRFEPDYVAAVATYRRLVEEYAKGETRYFDQATSRIKSITSPELSVSVDRYFVPGSEVQYQLRSRNLPTVELALYPVDLTEDVTRFDDSVGAVIASIEVEGITPVGRCVHATGDEGLHRRAEERLLVSERPEPGAYVLVARGGERESRELILVSDALLTIKQAKSGTLVWFTDLETGKPIPEAAVFVGERHYKDGGWRERSRTAVTDADGLAFFTGEEGVTNQEVFAAARTGKRQAFAAGRTWMSRRAEDTWRVYAFADRPAYRPEDAVRWKLLARVDTSDGYETPAGDKVSWHVMDPRGAEIAQGDAILNAYGAVWGQVETEAASALGMYHLEVRAEGRRVWRGELFRLEEYKLPEFEVTVDLPEDPERPGSTRLFRLGDTVEAQIETRYYYGGAVAGAEVEVLVYQRPYHHAWPVPREYPWLYADTTHMRGWWGGPGQLVQQETLTADADGRLVLPIQTPAGSSNDLEYTIEARVVDSSRREVVARDTLRVTRQAYFVRVEPEHRLHAPGDRVDLKLEARDANGNPIAAAGEVIVTRDTWAEIWRDPRGAEVRGAALERQKAARPQFPPPDEPGWQLLFNGYEHEEVARTQVMIGADGEGRSTFKAQRKGYYTVTWTSQDDRRQRVRAHTTFWVADEHSEELGYRQSGVEILVDRDTFEAGRAVPVMLSVPASDRYVLFTVEGEDLKHAEVVHVTGTVKLLSLQVVDAYVPNVWLGALMVSDRTTYWDQEEVIVPPAKQFLDVAIELDRAGYEPGAGGTATVTVKDHRGAPVTGEVSLAIYDAALSYIQGELAGDPRQRFYGERDSQSVRMGTTLHQRRFQRLVESDDGGVFDEEMQEVRADMLSNQARAIGLGGGASDGFFLGEGTVNLRASAGPSSPGPSGPSVSRELRKSVYRGPGDSVPPAGGGGGGGLPAGSFLPGEIEVRTDFRDTAVWAAAVVCDAEGQARIDVPFPDSTTRWIAVARACDTGARFGIGEASVRTRQPLIARLQAPRFFQVGDEVILSGNLNNDSEAAMIVHAVLEAEGVELRGRLSGAELLPPQAGPIEIPPGGQARVDWVVRVLEPGEVVLRLKAGSPDHTDGMELTLPAQARGVPVLLARSGKMTASELALDVDLPDARGAGTTSLEVQLTPSLAVTMLDALPYLADYPYGCTEQTLSRFVPSVVVQKTLADLGLSADEALERVYGGIEREHVDATQRDVTGIDRLDRAIDTGLDRLYGFQHSDGGWAWWKTGDSDHWMSAYVLWGLTLARASGVEVRAEVIERAARFVELELVEQEVDVDMQAWMLFALAAHLARTEGASEAAGRAFDNIWARRSGLNAYTRALFALAAHDLGRAEQASVLVENLANGVIRDDSPDTSIVMVGEQSGRADAMRTAHWGEDGVWYRWSEGGVEATAFALRAFMEIDPDHELVQPTLNWLLQNRRAAQWSNTRDTAVVVLALAKYLRASGELGSDVAYELVVNGETVATERLSKDALLRAPSRYAIDPALLRAGKNEVRVVQSEGSPLYFATYARFQSAEDPIPARGNQVFVRREYYRLKPVPTLLKGVYYEKEKLADGARVQSGDRIEVVLTAETKNHLEYLVFEDNKPAGFESVQVRSGEWMIARELKSSEVGRRFADGGRREEITIPGASRTAYAWQREEGYTGRSRGLHQELRDRHVALFVDRMPEGVWEMRYELRAETPGEFQALPVLGHAMYVPEIRCNSKSLRVSVADRDDPGPR